MREKVIILRSNAEACGPIKEELSDFYDLHCVGDVHSVVQYIKQNSDLKVLIIDIDTPKLVAEQLLEFLTVHPTFKRIKIIVAANIGNEMRVARLLNNGALIFC